jgi:hypothetical protein
MNDVTSSVRLVVEQRELSLTESQIRSCNECGIRKVKGVDESKGVVRVQFLFQVTCVKEVQATALKLPDGAPPGLVPMTNAP